MRCLDQHREAERGRSNQGSILSYIWEPLRLDRGAGAALDRVEREDEVIWRMSSAASARGSTNVGILRRRVDRAAGRRAARA